MTLQGIASHVRGFVVRHKRVGALAERAVIRFPLLQDVAARVVRARDPERRYAEWLAAYDIRDSDGGAFPDGEFVILVAPNTVLRPNARAAFARAIAEHPHATLVYGDDDAIDDDGVRTDPRFKPDWNPTLLHAQNYIGGAVCVRRSSAPAGDVPDEDAVWSHLLRLAASLKEQDVVHIPAVLTHRRGPDRAARDAEAHRARLAATGENVEGVEPVGDRSFRVRYGVPSPPPRVSVIVPTTGRSDVLTACLDGLTRRTAYPSVDVNVVVGPDAEWSTADPGVRILRIAERGPFNFARTMNWASRKSGAAPLLCFVNDDTEVRDPEWLSELVAQVSRPRVAAAGAKLLFPSGRIQHGGIVVGAGIVAAHAYRGDPDGTPGYHERALVAQEVSAVTAACMLIRREAFEAVGGFDERLAIAFNDIDLCLRLRDAGWRIVWTPEAALVHRESISIGRHDAREGDWEAERQLMEARWGQPAGDPHYNANLSLDAMRLWEPAFPPRVRT